WAVGQHDAVHLVYVGLPRCVCTCANDGCTALEKAAENVLFRTRVDQEHARAPALVMGNPLRFHIANDTGHVRVHDFGVRIGTERSQDGAVLSENACDLARVDAGQGRDAFAFQPIAEGRLRHVMTGESRFVRYDETGYLDSG